MTRKEWKKIRQAADLLGLEERASLAEIKKAFRRLSKKHHPDMQKDSKQKVDKVEMHTLTEAYQALLQYCSEYRFPMIPGEKEQFEGEDWWFERFGGDHHWGKGSMPNEDTDE